MYLLFIFLFTTTVFSQTVTKKDEKKAYERKLQDGVDSKNRRELTEDELLQKFFNKKADPNAQKNTNITFPVFYESMSNPLGDVRIKGEVKLGSIQNFEIDANAMLLILTELVDPTWLVRLDSIKNNCAEKNAAQKKVPNSPDADICWVPFSNFADTDVRVVFNELNLEIRIYVLPALRSVKVTSVTQAVVSTQETTDQNSFFSSYLNFNLNQNIQSDNIIYKNGREPFTARYENGTRFGEVVIEATGRSTERRQEVVLDEPSLVREKTRGVYDFTSYGSRLQVGDLTYPVKSFQIYQQMAGLSLFSQSSLKSSQVTLPGESFELNLLRPSKVSIYINEKLSQTIQLPAGRHDLRDFPFITGENDLKLEIEDDQGHKETSTRSILINNQLLKPSQHEISYAIGMPSTEVSGVQVYDSKNPTASIFHRYGWSQSLTLGANAQADKNQFVGGIEFLFPSRFGFFLIEPAHSLNKDKPSGYAVRIRLILPDEREADKPTKFSSFEAESTSEGFAQLGNLSPTNLTSTRFKTTHARGISKTLSVNVSLGYSFNRQGADSYTIALGGSKRWIPGLSTNLSFQHIKNLTGAEEITTSLFLIWSPPKERQFITASTESASGTTRADWTYQPKSGVGDAKTHLNLQNKKIGRSYGGDIEYMANRYRLTAAHQVELRKGDLTTSPPTQDKSIHTTNLQLGTAVVFAGGHFAISRPVYDSFIIFSPLKNLQNENVRVNPQDDGSYLYETDWLGAAVVSEMPSYTYSSFVLKQQNNQQGLSLPRDNFIVRPKYRSGYAITIGTEATIYLKTTITNSDGSPASMIVAKAIYLDDSDAEAVTVFTNRSGLIRSEGFRHGRYRLEVTGDEYEPAEFTIPDSAPDEFDMQPIQLKVKKK